MTARGDTVRFSLSPAGPRRMRAWLTRHLQTFFYTLGLLSRTPVASLLTAAVIGMALALPAGLYLLLANVEEATRDWDGSSEISLFLRLDAGDADAAALAGRLAEWPEVARTRVITRAQALEEFRALSGFADVMDAFAEDNPLPAVVVLAPAVDVGDATVMERLLARVEALPEVDFAQFDLAWLKRLYGILAIVERGVLVVAVLLAGAVLLVVGNTLRLGIENRRREIEIAKLFGATDAFIRRPFLYSGLLFGILGGLIALVLVWGCVLVLAGPVERLAGLYAGDFHLQGLGPLAGLALPLAGAALGLLGSWLSVGRHLAAIEPS